MSKTKDSAYNWTMGMFDMVVVEEQEASQYRACADYRHSQKEGVLHQFLSFNGSRGSLLGELYDLPVDLSFNISNPTTLANGTCNCPSPSSRLTRPGGHAQGHLSLCSPGS